MKSHEAKERLKPALDAGNMAKTLAAPVTAILGMEIYFYEQLPKLFPHADARAWFKNLPDLECMALRNSSLQGAYFMLAARALGLDCGPLSRGFITRTCRGLKNRVAQVWGQYSPSGLILAGKFLCRRRGSRSRREKQPVPTGVQADY